MENTYTVLRFVESIGGLWNVICATLGAFAIFVNARKNRANLEDIFKQFGHHTDPHQAYFSGTNSKVANFKHDFASLMMRDYGAAQAHDKEAMDVLQHDIGKCNERMDELLRAIADKPGTTTTTTTPTSLSWPQKSNNNNGTTTSSARSSPGVSTGEEANFYDAEHELIVAATTTTDSEHEQIVVASTLTTEKGGTDVDCI